MQLIRVTKKLKDYKQVKQLYHQAFPRNERAPFWLLMKKSKQPSADFWALYDNENWLGIAYIVKGEQLAYLFYLAIKPEARGKGYGKKVIDILKERYQGCKFFLALEKLDKTAPNYEQRVKRHSFYEKCGLSDMPYQIKEGPVIYDIMGIGGNVEPQEYQGLLQNYMGKFYCRFIDMRMVE